MIALAFIRLTNQFCRSEIERDQLRKQQDRDYSVAQSADLKRHNELNRKMKIGFSGNCPVEPLPSPDVVSIRFRLPHGLPKSSRRFLFNDSVSVIFQYLREIFVDHGVMENFSVFTNFPRFEILDQENVAIHDLVRLIKIVSKFLFIGSLSFFREFLVNAFCSLRLLEFCMFRPIKFNKIT